MQLTIARKIVELPIQKTCHFPSLFVCLPEGNLPTNMTRYDELRVKQDLQLVAEGVNSWICSRNLLKIKHIPYRLPKWWMSAYWKNKKSPSANQLHTLHFIHTLHASGIFMFWVISYNNLITSNQSTRAIHPQKSHQSTQSPIINIHLYSPHVVVCYIIFWLVVDLPL